MAIVLRQRSHSGSYRHDERKSTIAADPLRINDHSLCVMRRLTLLLGLVAAAGLLAAFVWAAADTATRRIQRDDLSELALPAEERRRGHGQVGAVERLEGRKLALAELVHALGGGEVLERCSPRSLRPSLPVKAAVEAETSTCPPWPAAAMRAARCSSIPT